LSKVENGLLALEGEPLARVAAALKVPVDLLTTDEPVRGLEVTCLHHRHRRSRMTVGVVKRVESVTHLTRLTVEGLSSGLQVEPGPRLRRMDIDEHGSPAEIARLLRLAWRVPTGPVADVTQLVEALGVYVVRRDLGTSAQDAVSTWPPGSAPVILVNQGLPPDRERFTLLHELGHLIMHELPDDDQERQANQFAGEFLAPADEIRPALEGLTARQFNKLAELKITWGMSMAALIQRALDLDCISPNQFKTFRIRLNQYGWSHREPGEVRVETPSALDAVIDAQLAKHHDEAEVAALALMLPDQFHQHYLAHRAPADGSPAAQGSSR
jgi:Zn-dependent peptidase ImmA (M78 family)